MKIKNLFLFGILITLLSFTNTIRIDLDSNVYVCGKSTIYHLTNSHAALKRCTSGITKMKESEALDLGKRVCRCKF